MTMVWRCVATLAVVFLSAGCVNVTRDITTYDQFVDYQLKGPNTLRVMATDRSIYELAAYTLQDSVIEGIGVRITEDGQSEFAGRLPLNTLVFVQGSEPSVGRTLATLSFMGFVGLSAVYAWQDHGLSVYRPSRGSCPYVYAWNGREYVLQGEVFGTSFGKALEASTACMLPAVSPRSPAIRVKVTNERPESHYLDAIRALAFEAPVGSMVLLDNIHRAWQVREPIPPRRSPEELRRVDGVRWRSDLSSTGAGGSNRDVLELCFPRPQNRHAGSVIVHAINTQLVNAVYDMIFGYLGEESIRFLYQVERDSECIRVMRDWIADCSLTIEVWKEGQWVHEGSVAPEANAAPFSRIVRVSSDGIFGDSIRIRLSSLADMWELDAVEIDWTPAGALTPYPLAIRRTAETVSCDGPVSARDGRYALLLPGELIEMEFDAHVPSQGHAVAYALEATGYLYEWPLGDERPVTSPFMSAAFERDQSGRVEVVNFLITNKELFLPLVYEHWKSLRPPASDQR